MVRSLVPSLLLLCLSACSPDDRGTRDPADWPHYLGDRGTTQFSALTQIDTSNVALLQPVWSYASGDVDTLNRGQMQCNPLVIDGVLYGTNPRLKAFAVDAATGEQLWQFDPADHTDKMFGMGNNRGLSYWTDGEQSRIYYPAGSYLHALDATTGRPIESFGAGGRLDLHTGLGEAAKEQFVVMTSPGIIFEDKIIVGARVSEDRGAAPGHIRAFNLHTGELEWTFRTLPAAGSPGSETWLAGIDANVGGANAWSGFSLDESRGYVFVPTGSASYDFYGGNRPGDNLYANCILALDARTGAYVWHYQTVHHDLWDRDHPAPPVLLPVNHNGKEIDAVAQTMKSGHVFLLDRDNGKPLFPVEEVSVPASDLEGEWTSPTQPLPTLPPPFTRQRIDPEQLYPYNDSINRLARDLVAKSRYGGQFIPPSEEGTLLFPGFDGGAEWGGAAYDPDSRLFFVNANEMPWMVKMNPMSSFEGLAAGHRVYKLACQACHGEELEGGGVFESPSLRGLATRLDAPAVGTIIRQGRGAMPAVTWLDDEQIQAVTEWVLAGNAGAKNPPEAASTPPTNNEPDWPHPYIMDGYKRFQTAEGPALTSPPWGTLTAIDLDAGSIRWQVPLGEYPHLVAEGIRNTGSENYGGPVATAGGVLFIAATLDEKIRAFRSRDGKLLWEAKLPAAGYATPAVYEVAGKQYVVVACGGGKLGTDSGDAYVAFAL